MFAVLGALITGKAQGVPIFVALCAFVLGLLSLAIGAFCSLLLQTRVLREMEDVDLLLDMKPSKVLRPSQEAGLTIYSAQTVTGILSAVLFFAGAIFSLYYVITVAQH